MKHKLKDYILHLDNWVPKNIVDKTVEELNKDKNWIQHTYSDSQTFELSSKNGDKELDISFAQELTYLKDFYDLVWKGLEKYIITSDISNETFKGWKGFSSIRFNRYKNNQIMSRHCDHIHSLFSGEARGIPILSVLGVLNDNYKGGEFIMFDDYEIKFKPGDVIIFPSIFMYPHLVKPVTEGVRYSFVSWCY